MKPLHTPGPWEVSKHGTPEYAPQFGVYASDSTRDHVIVQGENAQADARLIAAAPDLLEALQAILEWTEAANHTQAGCAEYFGGEARKCNELARAALAKVQS